MTIITLLNMRARQGINSQFIFGKLGWFIMLFEFSGLITIIYAVMHGYFHTRDTMPVFLLAFTSLLGSDYLSAEKYLSSPENRYDLLTGIPAQEIIWAIYGLVLWNSLRVTSFFPLIIIAVNKTVSPGLILLTFVFFPAAAASLACLFNILIKRHLKQIAGMFYLLFSLVWAGSIAAILGLLFTNHKLSLALLSNREVLLFLLLLAAFALVILCFSSPLASLWKTAYLLSGSVTKTVPFKIFHLLSHLLTNSFTVKEWVLLWRNPVTRLRLVVWAALLVICSLTPLKSYLHDPKLFMAISLGVWLFCYAEIPATAWQNEGEQKAFYWLSGFNPAKLMIAKIVVYLPAAVLGILTALFFGLAIHLSLGLILRRAALIFWLVLSATIIALAIASLGYDGTKSNFDNVIFEQVPWTKSGIAAVAIEFIFCCIVFSPFYWIIFISATIPVICLIGQAIWLRRSYYAA
ncbi:MAG: hypothetical protein ABRQ24_02475 [Syntrophomonadaceae bacterium]